MPRTAIIRGIQRLPIQQFEIAAITEGSNKGLLAIDPSLIHDYTDQPIWFFGKGTSFFSPAGSKCEFWDKDGAIIVQAEHVVTLFFTMVVEELDYKQGNIIRPEDHRYIMCESLHNINTVYAQGLLPLNSSQMDGAGDVLYRLESIIGETPEPA